MSGILQFQEDELLQAGGAPSAIHGPDLDTSLVQVYFSAASDPTVNNDGVDTAGLGEKFFKGVIWVNEATNQRWQCDSIATGAAVWTLVQPMPASQVEMEVGTESALRLVSPLRVAQAIAVLGGGDATPTTPIGLVFYNDHTNPTTDFIIGAGSCYDLDTKIKMTLAVGQRKNMTATWATGPNAGAITATAFGTIGWVASQSYFVFIAKIAGVDEIIVDTDLNGANIILDHAPTAMRRIMGFLSDAGPAIPDVVVTDVGGSLRVSYSTVHDDYAGFSVGSTAGSSFVVRVPLGSRTVVELFAILSEAALNRLRIYDGGTVTGAIGNSNMDALVSPSSTQAATELSRTTNTLGQLRFKTETTTCNLWFSTRAYYFPRSV